MATTTTATPAVRRSRSPSKTPPPLPDARRRSRSPSQTPPPLPDALAQAMHAESAAVAAAGLSAHQATSPFAPKPKPPATALVPRAGRPGARTGAGVGTSAEAGAGVGEGLPALPSLPGQRPTTFSEAGVASLLSTERMHRLHAEADERRKQQAAWRVQWVAAGSKPGELAVRNRADRKWWAIWLAEAMAGAAQGEGEFVPCAKCGATSELDEDEDNPGIFYCNRCWEEYEDEQGGGGGGRGAMAGACAGAGAASDDDLGVDTDFSGQGGEAAAVLSEEAKGGRKTHGVDRVGRGRVRGRDEHHHLSMSGRGEAEVAAAGVAAAGVGAPAAAPVAPAAPATAAADDSRHEDAARADLESTRLDGLAKRQAALRFSMESALRMRSLEQARLRPTTARLHVKGYT